MNQCNPILLGPGTLSSMCILFSCLLVTACFCQLEAFSGL